MSIKYKILNVNASGVDVLFFTDELVDLRQSEWETRALQLRQTTQMTEEQIQELVRNEKPAGKRAHFSFHNGVPQSPEALIQLITSNLPTIEIESLTKSLKAPADLSMFSSLVGQEQIAPEEPVSLDPELNQALNFRIV